MKKLRIFALGGNELAPIDKVDAAGKSVQVTLEDEWKRTAKTCELIAKVIKNHPDDYFVVTHGNGPQVGALLRRAELAKNELSMLPLDVLVGATQGSMGHMLTQLSNLMELEGLSKKSVNLLTQVIVDRNDPAFKNPDKYIGSSLTKEEAQEKQEKEGWQVKFYKKDEKGKEIWRRVVPSPRPQEVIEIEVIELLLKNGFIPIAGGGGGVPVAPIEPTLQNGKLIYKANHEAVYESHCSNYVPKIYSGIEAVIDKDLASALIGTELVKRMPGIEAELFIFTNVDGAKLNYQKPDQKDLLVLGHKEAEAFLAQGVFPGGSMGPKIQACINFVKNGGKRACITKVDLFEETLLEKRGTTIVF